MAFTNLIAPVTGFLLNQFGGNGGGGSNGTAAESNTAQQQVDLGQKAYDWYNQKYADLQPQLDASGKFQTDLANSQQQVMSSSLANADQGNKAYSSTFLPLMNNLATKAQNYDTPDREDAESGRAMANVTQQAALTRQANNDNMARMGVNPSSGQAMAAGNQLSMSEALGKASAGTNARLQTQKTGFDMGLSAAKLGDSISQNAYRSNAVAQQAGNSASALSALPLTQQLAAAGMIGQGFGVYNQALASAGGMQGAVASLNQRTNDSNNALLGNLGSGLASAYKTYRGQNPGTGGASYNNGSGGDGAGGSGNGTTYTMD